MVREIRLEIPRRLVEQFKRQAKAAWPREAFAFLLGRDAGDVVEFEDLYVPDGIQATETEITHNPAHMVEAREFAHDDGLDVVGDIHSHPRRYARWGGSLLERTPSEGDHEIGWRGIAGVCVVAEQRDGRLRAAVKFYGPSIPVVERVI